MTRRSPPGQPPCTTFRGGWVACRELSVGQNGTRHGMLAQLHPVTEKIHASSAEQNPLHSGALASPHAVVRHSHAPPDTTAEQWPPSAHVPSQRRVVELKSHGPLASVVVVVALTPPGQVVSPACRQSRRTSRWHRRCVPPAATQALIASLQWSRHSRRSEIARAGWMPSATSDRRRSRRENVEGIRMREGWCSPRGKSITFRSDDLRFASRGGAVRCRRPEPRFGGVAPCRRRGQGVRDRRVAVTR